MSNDRYYVRMEKSGILVISDYLPQDAVAITKDEYDEVMAPTLAQRRKSFLLGPSSTKEKKRYLFETLKCELTIDGNFEEIPGSSFHEGMTVDEMTQEYTKYVGDDDDRASLILERKRAAKAYVRDFVNNLT